MRGRNRKGPNPMSRTYESNGPDVKIRGTANHIADKYVQLSRDALSSGDPVAAENYMQHAEHYYRMLAAAQQATNPTATIVRADDEREEYETDGSEDNGAEGEAEANAAEDEQPREVRAPLEEPLREVQASAENREPREGRMRGRGRGGRNQGEPRAPAAAPQPQLQMDSDEPMLPAFITGGGTPVTERAEGDEDEDEGAPRRGRRRRSRYGRAGGEGFDAEGGAAASEEPVPVAE